MTTNTEHRRRETDRLGPYVQQVALDNANARIAELEAMAWQPIATAPKDGTSILIYEKWGDVFIARWVVNAWIPSTYNVGIDGDACFNFDTNSEYFTHWMPLPPPPAEKQSDLTPNPAPTRDN